MPDYTNILSAYVCDCGQLAPEPVCATCRAVDREPQGEAMALFTPAPAPMPGQTSF